MGDLVSDLSLGVQLLIYNRCINQSKIRKLAKVIKVPNELIFLTHLGES